MKCKICGAVLQTLVEHTSHFELHHRVSIHSLILCGVENCHVKVKNLDGYQQHFSVCHETNVDSSLLKCPYPNCNFKARSKATLRSHKFWHPPVESVESPPPPECDSVEEENFCEVQLPMLPETDNFDPTALEDSLAKRLTHMSLSLTSKYHVPDSTLSYVLQTYSTLLKESSAITSKRVRQEFNSQSDSQSDYSDKILEILAEDPLLKLHGPKGPLRSYHCRKKQYEQFPYVKPISVDLGPNKEMEQCKYHYVPIKESIKLMFMDDSVYEQYLENRRRRSSVLVSPDLTDIHSGAVYRENKLFAHNPDSLEIILFQDDIELVKALGAAAGCHKMMHVGFTLGNLHPWNRSKVDPLQLVLLCKEKNVSYHGLPKVLKEMIADLKDLETNGIEIRGENVKATVLVLLGDNLGTHTIGGFLENFSSAKYFCRYCEESRDEWKARWNFDKDNEESSESEESEDDSDSDSGNEQADGHSAPQQCHEEDSDEDIPLADIQRRLPKKLPIRTVESYKDCLAEVELKKPKSGVKGIVADCQLNKLKYFHVIGGSPPCVPHDIFEGFGRYDVQLCLQKLSKTYGFSLSDVNARLALFEFQETDKQDKPPKKITCGEKQKKIKGNAVQVWTFIRFLPLLIGDKIKDKSNPIWVMILTLIEIIQLITSPVISRSSINYVEKKILKYLTLRTRLFPKIPLRPKHHFFEHYPYLLLQYGPLMRSSTLRFESKHKFFRSEFSNKKCLKNPTKSIATAHQKMQSSLHIEDMFERCPTVKEAMPFSMLPDDVKTCIQNSFGLLVASKLLFSAEITFHNVLYKKGAVVVISTDRHPQIECLKIDLLTSDGKFAHAIGRTCSASLLEPMSIYLLTETNKTKIVNLNNLKDYSAYPTYQYNLKSALVLKYLYREMLSESMMKAAQVSCVEDSAVRQDGEGDTMPGSSSPGNSSQENLSAMPGSSSPGNSSQVNLSAMPGSSSPGNSSQVNLSAMPGSSSPENSSQVNLSDDLFSDEDGDSADENQPPVLDFVLKFCRPEKREAVKQHLETLGVQTLSDLSVIDLDVQFLPVMNAVEIGYMKRAYEKIGDNDIQNDGLFIEYSKVFSHSQLNLLNGNRRLPHSDIINITSAMGDHLFFSKNAATQRLCKKVAMNLLSKFRKALESTSKDIATVSLTNQIRNRMKYRSRLEKKKRRPSDDRAVSVRLSKRKSYGIEECKDLPLEFPPGETKETQENKRKEMVQMSESGEINWVKVKKLMQDTYVAQRITVNALNNVDLILKEWPFIGKFTILKAHFNQLMGKDDVLEETMDRVGRKIIEFLKAQANIPRKGNAAETSKSIRCVVRAYDQASDKTAGLEFVTIFLGLAAKMDVNLGSLFLHFSDTTSYDEVQASNTLPKDGKPIVAVLGDDLMKLPKCFVLVDNTIISRGPVTPLKAILSAFMAYFVFKITYPKSLLPLLNFLERDIFLLNFDNIPGSRVERRKISKGTYEENPSSLSAKYITFKRQLEDHAILWDC